MCKQSPTWLTWSWQADADAHIKYKYPTFIVIIAKKRWRCLVLTWCLWAPVYIICFQLFICRWLYICICSCAPCRHRPWHVHIHELHEESLLLWCHPYQLQTGHFWHNTTGTCMGHLIFFFCTNSLILTTIRPTTAKTAWQFGDVIIEKLSFVRWRRLSLLWWLTVWGQRHCGTTSLSVLWVSHNTSLFISVKVSVSLAHTH